MSMDVDTGVAVNTSLTIVDNLSVGGELSCPNIYTKDDCDARYLQRYPINAANCWVHLGTLYSTQVGRSAVFDITTTNGFNAIATQHKIATMQFVTSNGGEFQSGVIGGGFYGSCTIRCTTGFPTVRIVQIFQTEFQFWIQMPQYSGGSFFTIACGEQDTFVLSGSYQIAEPAGVYIIPTTLFSWDVDTLESGQLQSSGTLLKLKSGTSGTQILDSSNNILVEANTAGVSTLRNLSVLVNSTNAQATINNTSGSGFSSSYMTAAGVTSQLFVGSAALVLATNTNHPMRFATNRFVNATSLTIEANGQVVCNSSMCNTSDSRLKDKRQRA